MGNKRLADAAWHHLLIAPPHAEPGFKPWPDDEDFPVVMPNLAGNGIYLFTLIADGPIWIEVGERPPEGEGWDGPHTVDIEIAGLLMGFEYFDTEPLGDVFTPAVPGQHTVQVWTRDRKQKRYDHSLGPKKRKHLEHYYLVFTPASQNPSGAARDEESLDAGSED